MMKNLIVFLACGCLFFLNFSAAPGPAKTVTSWTSVEYINCLNKSLPCDCERKVDKYISISIDTTSNPGTERISLFGHAQLEPNLYELNRLSKNGYEILDGAEKPQKLGIITFNNGSLYLHDQDGDTRFVKTGTSNNLDNNNFEVENVSLINKALKQKGYPGLNKMLSEGTLECNCNSNYKTDMVYLHKTPHAWVLEQAKDSLYIYKMLNEDGDPDDAIIKKKIFQFKWK